MTVTFKNIAEAGVAGTPILNPTTTGGINAMFDKTDGVSAGRGLANAMGFTKDGNILNDLWQGVKWVTNPVGTAASKVINTQGITKLIGSKLGGLWHNMTYKGQTQTTPITFGRLQMPKSSLPINDLNMNNDIQNSINGMNTGITQGPSSIQPSTGLSQPQAPTISSGLINGMTPAVKDYVDRVGSYKNQLTQGGKYSLAEALGAINGPSRPPVLTPGDKAIAGHDAMTQSLANAKFRGDINVASAVEEEAAQQAARLAASKLQR